MRKLALVGFLLTGVGVVSGVFASEQKHSYTIPLTNANLNCPLTIQKFDSSLGILNEVELKATYHIETEVKIESTNSGPATITFKRTGIVSITKEDLTALLNGKSYNEMSVSLPAFDGVKDFSGPDTCIANLAGNTDMMNTFSGEKTTEYVGLPGETLNFLVKTTTASGTSGPGNMRVYSSSKVSLNLDVTYRY